MRAPVACKEKQTSGAAHNSAKPIKYTGVSGTFDLIGEEAAPKGRRGDAECRMMQDHAQHTAPRRRLCLGEAIAALPYRDMGLWKNEPLRLYLGLGKKATKLASSKWPHMMDGHLLIVERALLELFMQRSK